MDETTTCTNPDCPSRGKSRRVMAHSLCRYCYAEAWRKRAIAATVAYVFARAEEWLASRREVAA